MEPFALFNLLQSLLGKADAAPSEPPTPDTSDKNETATLQAEPNPTAKTQSENAAARFLDEHERRAKRLKN